MRYFILACVLFLGVINANAAMEGVYVNPQYNGPNAYQIASVEIRNNKGILELIFNIPCGSKIDPRIFRIQPTSGISGLLQLVYEGGSQCYTGTNPKFMILGNIIQIRVNPEIRTPGFSGVYQLTRQ